MCEAFENKPVPRLALISAAALITFSIALVAASRLGYLGPPVDQSTEIVEFRDLRFEDRDDGAVVVFVAGESTPLDVLAPGTNGFVRGVVRSIARARKQQQISSAPPIRLSYESDGRIMLSDPSTGYLVNLNAFGPTNSAAFARFFDTSDTKAQPQRTIQ